MSKTSKSPRNSHPAPNRALPAQVKHSVIWCGAAPNIGPKATKRASWSEAEVPHQIGLCPRWLERSASPERGKAESKDPQATKSTKCAGAQRQKPEILKNSYSCLYKHLRLSNLQKYPNFRTKRASRPKYEGRPFFAPKKEYRDYAHILN